MGWKSTSRVDSPFKSIPAHLHSSLAAAAQHSSSLNSPVKHLNRGAINVRKPYVDRDIRASCNLLIFPRTPRSSNRNKASSKRISFQHRRCVLSNIYFCACFLCLNDSSLAVHCPAYEWYVSHVYFVWQTQSAPASADGSIYISLLYPNNVTLAELHKV